MKEIHINKTYKLIKPPFIFEGVIIQQGSIVEVQDRDKDGTYKILYHDMERMPHTIPNIKAEELEEISKKF